LVLAARKPPGVSKEEVIVGRLFQAGTGGMLSRLRQIAIKHDKLIIHEQQRKKTRKRSRAFCPE
jgi:DNA-directed RNA polymerase subunit beta'